MIRKVKWEELTAEEEGGRDYEVEGGRPVCLKE